MVWARKPQRGSEREQLLDSAGSFGVLSRFYLFPSAAPPIPSLSDRRHLAQAPSNHLPVGYQSSSSPTQTISFLMRGSISVYKAFVPVYC